MPSGPAMGKSSAYQGKFVSQSRKLCSICDLHNILTAPLLLFKRNRHNKWESLKDSAARQKGDFLLDGQLVATPLRTCRMTNGTVQYIMKCSSTLYYIYTLWHLYTFHPNLESKYRASGKAVVKPRQRSTQDTQDSSPCIIMCMFPRITFSSGLEVMRMSSQSFQKTKGRFGKPPSYSRWAGVRFSAGLWEPWKIWKLLKIE